MCVSTATIGWMPSPPAGIGANATLAAEPSLLLTRSIRPIPIGLKGFRHQVAQPQAHNALFSAGALRARKYDLIGKIMSQWASALGPSRGNGYATGWAVRNLCVTQDNDHRQSKWLRGSSALRQEQLTSRVLIPCAAIAANNSSAKLNSQVRLS